jgi:hypothetical protein
MKRTCFQAGKRDTVSCLFLFLVFGMVKILYGLSDECVNKKGERWNSPLKSDWYLIFKQKGCTGNARVCHFVRIKNQIQLFFR